VNFKDSKVVLALKIHILCLVHLISLTTVLLLCLLQDLDGDGGEGYSSVDVSKFVVVGQYNFSNNLVQTERL
jgi:hypothetical protein